MSTAVQLKARLGELIQAAELGLMVAVQCSERDSGLGGLELVTLFV
jgi:hypothetical protein